MDSLELAKYLLAVAAAAPGGVFLLLGTGWLLGVPFREKVLTRITAAVYLLATLAAGGLALIMVRHGMTSVTVDAGAWFAVHEYRFPLILLADRLSVPLIALTALLTGLTGAFSARYLHRERGFVRFFLLLHLFGAGAVVLFAAGSYDLLIGGWELVGLTSVFLIGFFHERRDPVTNGLRVFAIYRGCDVGLLAGVAMLHHFGGSATYGQMFSGNWPEQTSSLTGWPAAFCAALLLLAAMGKSAQAPFSGWLPRAMEGPTPSSAIFYGAISVHAGVYLLLRSHALLAQAPVISAFMVVLGLVTAVQGTLAGRAAADAKTSLAHASVTQLGLIVAEIGAGFPMLALTHICGHAAVRTLQFLRAPSALHEHHQIHAASGGHMAPEGRQYEMLLPERTRAWLYRLAIDRGHLDTILDRFVVAPVMVLARFLNGLEKRASSLKGEPRPAAGEKPVLTGGPMVGDTDV